MTDHPAWATDKAREWLVKSGGPLEGPGVPDEYGWVPIADYSIASLAALLVDVAAVGKMVRAENAEYLSTLRADVLAEVRRVVEGLRTECSPEHAYPDVNACWACDEILARIEKL